MEHRRNLYSAPKDIAFAKIYDIVYSGEDDRYEISPQEIGDKNCFIFAVASGGAIRILAGEMKYIKEISRHDLNNVIVKETFITRDDFSDHFPII